ncbi:hypothetical protein DPEC_G00331510 [Dallia pectoralis]|uniref:Uncharacterized protein n=1 Tax=Dallia pectoralis TaxID=75939 RepID=A0ACC2F5S9_DALPE|nr:hypothetical protein DPEC_G00331510 [Dallia pectoralis]
MKGGRWRKTPFVPDKRLDRGVTFSRSQRVSCSATYETLTQNQVVYECFSTRLSTNFWCNSGEVATLIRPHTSQVPNGSTHLPLEEAGYPGPIEVPRRYGIIPSRGDSDLEAFSHNPTDGSFAPLAPQPSTYTKCLNLRFLSY